MTSSDQIWIVDDDEGILRSIEDLLESVGYRARSFTGAQSFLDELARDECACAVLDVRIGAESGLSLQRRISSVCADLPIIFVTGHGDVPMSVQAMKAGAIDFLQKPYREQELLDAISQALALSGASKEKRQLSSELRDRFRSLTRRERQVFRLVVDGKLNKQIAAELEISEVMVKVHRASVVKKMGANSLADLVRLSQKIDISDPAAEAE